MPAVASTPCTQRAPGSSSPLQAFWGLERWLSSSASRRLGLPHIEREAERRGRELLRLLLQAHVDGRGNGDIGAALRLMSSPDSGPLLLTHKRLHTRRLITLFGTVSIARMGYGRPGRRSLHPLDAELQLPARVYSYEIQRRLVKAAVQGPFDEALAWGGLPIPSESKCPSAAPNRSYWTPAPTSKASTSSARGETPTSHKVRSSWGPSTARASP